MLVRAARDGAADRTRRGRDPREDRAGAPRRATAPVPTTKALMVAGSVGGREETTITEVVGQVEVNGL